MKGTTFTHALRSAAMRLVINPRISVRSSATLEGVAACAFTNVIPREFSLNKHEKSNGILQSTVELHEPFDELPKLKLS
ncbi:hypothetical protein Dimus_019581 [Dionaea muscipula]